MDAAADLSIAVSSVVAPVVYINESMCIYSLKYVAGITLRSVAQSARRPSFESEVPGSNQGRARRILEC